MFLYGWWPPCLLQIPAEMELRPAVLRGNSLAACLREFRRARLASVRLQPAFVWPPTAASACPSCLGEHESGVVAHSNWGNKLPGQMFAASRSELWAQGLLLCLPLRACWPGRIVALDAHISRAFSAVCRNVISNRKRPGGQWKVRGGWSDVTAFGWPAPVHLGKALPSLTVFPLSGCYPSSQLSVVHISRLPGAKNVPCTDPSQVSHFGRLNMIPMSCILKMRFVLQSGFITARNTQGQPFKTIELYSFFKFCCCGGTFEKRTDLHSS